MTLHFSAHSPDNSFMGFVVEQHLLLNEYENITKKQQAVVYGKVASMWEVLIKQRDNGYKCPFCFPGTLFITVSEVRIDKGKT